jgi:hypothetical protein
MRGQRLAVLAFFAGPQLVGSASMAGTNKEAKLALHVVEHSFRTVVCSVPASDFPCNPGRISPFITSVKSPGAYDVYVFVTDGDSVSGVAGASFGISYDNTPYSGLDVISASFCGNMTNPYKGWPDSSSGVSVAWRYSDNCRRTVASGDKSRGVTVLVGCIRVYDYGPDILSLVPNPRDHQVTISNCACELDTLWPPNVGEVGFGKPGYDPCK